MSNKFEQLLDLIVNEEHEKANELFHEIVVEKSREIYENLIAEEEEEEEKTEESFAAEEEEEEATEESFAAEEEEEETTESIYSEEGEDDAEDGGEEEFPVQDKTDDLAGELDGEDEGNGDEPATKDDIDDLADALEELKAEFAKMAAGEEAEEEKFPGIHGDADMDAGAGPEEELMMSMGEEEEEEEGAVESFAAEEEEEDDEPKSEGQRMREYIERVTANMDGGLVGGRTGETQPAPTEGKSPVSSGKGKPTTGATAANIATHLDKHSEDGTSPKGKVGGLVKQGGQFVGSGTKNVAASANAKKPDGAKLSGVSKPSNKEGAGVGAVAGGDKAGQTGGVINKSPLNGAPNRNA